MHKSTSGYSTAFRNSIPHKQVLQDIKLFSLFKFSYYFHWHENQADIKICGSLWMQKQCPVHSSSHYGGSGFRDSVLIFLCMSFVVQKSVTSLFPGVIGGGSARFGHSQWSATERKSPRLHRAFSMATTAGVRFPKALFMVTRSVITNIVQRFGVFWNIHKQHTWLNYSSSSC